MSVLIVTSLGDIVVDLHTDRCPLTTKNFLKLSKIKYFNGCLFHTVQKDFTAQTGDPTGKGTGGDSIYKFLYGEQARFFGDEIHPELKHFKTGTVSMASAGENLNASQFYFTLRDDLEYLDGKHTVFGEVAEGLETLARINEAYVDEKGRPYKNIRIKHTYVLDDPFDDPPQLPELIPDASPEGKPKDEIDDDVRLEDDWVPMDEKLDPSELEEVLREKEAHSRAVVLESIGDIPDSEIKPPDNVLFVCKLNPVTEDDDLNTIFSRFGNVVSADIIRDYKTGDSLCYAFIEFETTEACEQAYFKMDNALIDDRRIHVDFSQSVAKLWSQYRRKDNQRGGGCFKCGAADHIAKDCTGGPSTKMLPPKYTLKDENTQRGGDDNSRYEMVFDGDTPVSSEGDKRRRGREPDDQNGKQRMDKRISEDIKYRDCEKRDSTSDRHKHDERSRGLKEDERNRGSRRDEEYHVVKETRDNVNLKSHGSHRDGRDEQDYRKKESHGDRREERDYRKKDSLGDRRDDRDYRKKGADSDGRGDGRDERDYKKRGADNDGRGDGRDERDYRKRGADSDSHRDGRDEQDYRKKESHGDRREERDYRKKDSLGDRRDDRDYRKKGADSDGRGDGRDERDYRKRGADSDGCGDRREDSRKRSADNDHDHRSGRRHQIEKRR